MLFYNKNPPHIFQIKRPKPSGSHKIQDASQLDQTAFSQRNTRETGSLKTGRINVSTTIHYMCLCTVHTMLNIDLVEMISNIPEVQTVPV